jgi:hypothetical protein
MTSMVGMSTADPVMSPGGEPRLCAVRRRVDGGITGEKGDTRQLEQLRLGGPMLGKFYDWTIPILPISPRSGGGVAFVASLYF